MLPRALLFLPLLLNAQTVSTIAGDGIRGFSDTSIALANLQNGCGDPSRFEQTSQIAVDAKGVVYFTDSQNQRIRRINADGTMTTQTFLGKGRWKEVASD